MSELLVRSVELQLKVGRIAKPGFALIASRSEVSDLFGQPGAIVAQLPCGVCVNRLISNQSVCRFVRVGVSHHELVKGGQTCVEVVLVYARRKPSIGPKLPGGWSNSLRDARWTNCALRLCRHKRRLLIVAARLKLFYTLAGRAVVPCPRGCRSMLPRQIAYRQIMGLLDRWRAHRDETALHAVRPSPGRLMVLPDDNFVKVVGESHCQPALQALSSECIRGPDERPAFPAALVPEPDNPVDPDAIAVHSPKGRVGYLAREDAQRYVRTMRAVREAGYDGGSCTGLLNGGDRDRPSYGVVLQLAHPELCELHLGISGGRQDAGGHRPVSGKTEAGKLRGRHFTEYAEEVKTLRRYGHDDSAERLLLELLEVNEAEAREMDWGVAPWYYEQLAIVRRKRSDIAAEVQVLERYAAAPHAPGAGPAKLAERLEKARQLAARQP